MAIGHHGALTLTVSLHVDLVRRPDTGHVQTQRHSILAYPVLARTSIWAYAIMKPVQNGRHGLIGRHVL
jgi:hypothetical protein